MNDSKKIYILLATYNGAAFLEEQIDSILAQSLSNWILWIHDDGSTDETTDIINRYSLKYKDKILIIDDEVATGGAKENFTYMLNKIDDDFDYLMFADQDDVWLDDKIEVTLKTMRRVEFAYPDRPVLVHTDLLVVDEKLREIAPSMVRFQKLCISHQNNLSLLAMDNVVTGCTIMLNRCLALKSKCIPQEAVMHDWWIAIVALKEGGVIEFIDQPTIFYRQHADNAVGFKNRNLSYYLIKIMDLKFIFDLFFKKGKTYKQCCKVGVVRSRFLFLVRKMLIEIKKIFLYSRKCIN